MKVLVQDGAGFTRAELGGGQPLDHLNASFVRSEITRRVVPGGVLLLHLGTVPSIDSAGVGTLVAILRAVRAANGRMALIDVKPQVFAVLETIRLTTIFELYATDEAALASLLAVPAGA